MRDPRRRNILKKVLNQGHYGVGKSAQQVKKAQEQIRQGKPINVSKRGLWQKMFKKRTKKLAEQ